MPVFAVASQAAAAPQTPAGLAQASGSASYGKKMVPRTVNPRQRPTSGSARHITHAPGQPSPRMRPGVATRGRPPGGARRASAQ